MSKYVGVTCERSKQQGRPYVTREECNTCLKDANHPCPFHGKMLARLWRDGDSEPQAHEFSPTRLLACPRKRYLSVHKEEEILDPRTAYPAMRGHFVHGFFEKLPFMAPGIVSEISEERFSTQIQTSRGLVTFQGKPDLIEILSHTEEEIVIKVVDWKSKSDIPHSLLKAQENHEYQVNMYAWLLAKTLPEYFNQPDLRVVLDELEIVYMDMRKPRRFTSKCSLYDNGKIKTPRRLKEYEQLDLEKMHKATVARMEVWIKRKIEEAFRSETTMALPYEGDMAKLCDYCSFNKVCHRIYETEGR